MRVCVCVDGAASLGEYTPHLCVLRFISSFHSLTHIHTHTEGNVQNVGPRAGAFVGEGEKKQQPTAWTGREGGRGEG